MANFSEYEIHVKGKKENVLLFFTTMQSENNKNVVEEKQSNNDYIMHFSGSCYGGFDHQCKSEISHEKALLTLMGTLPNKPLYITLEGKSSLFDLDIEIHSWSFDAGYDCFYRYKNGKTLIEEYKDFVPDIEWCKDEFEEFEDLMCSLSPDEIYFLENAGITEDDFKKVNDNLYELKIKNFEFSF